MKKRILFIAENLYCGGVERILQIVLKNFDYEKYDVTLYSSRPETLHPDYYPTSIRLQHYFESCGANALLYKKIRCRIINKLKLLVYYHLSPTWFYRLFIKGKYDVGIAFIEGYATRILSGGPKNMKKIAWVHTDIGTNHWTTVAYRSLSEETDCYKQFKYVVCVSNVVAQSYEKTFHNSNHLVLHNPIDSKSIIKKANISIENCFFHNNSLKIVSLGRLSEVKGYFRLLDAFKKLHNSDKLDIELYILGSGEQKERLSSHIVSHNMQSYVHLLGFKENPYPYLKQADIYVCSSYAEGYNTAISEALILHRAIVTTEVSGAKEQLGDSEYGIVTENSTDGIYLGLKTMITQNLIPYYQEKAAIRGKDYSLFKQMDKIYKLLE